MSETVEIVRLAHGGDGVTPAGEFVPYTAPGDVVRIARAGARLRVEEIVQSGPSRANPACRHFGRCGGCAVQHLEQTTYLAWKRDLVIAALAQRGLDDAMVAPIRTVAPGTRRRAVFKARRIAGAVALGFYERESRNLIDIIECPLLVPELEKCLGPLKASLGEILEDDQTAELHASVTDAGVDLSLKLKHARTPDFLMALAQLAAQLNLARLVWNGEPVSIARAPFLRMGRHRIDLPPEPFLQPTKPGEKILQDLVRDGLKDMLGPGNIVADLFSGCGTFALILADRCSVVAVEDRADMHEALAAASAESGADLKSERRDLFRRPLLTSELARFDAVVLDPPRPGARAQAEQLARSAVARVVYVSCNPASFARDARILCDGGYRLACIVPVDQFLWSAHVELVATLVRDG